MEITGDRCEAKVEGLRPGTSYQVNQRLSCFANGRNPFGVASEPIATYPLNLDGSTTAGWMKYGFQLWSFGVVDEVKVLAPLRCA